MKILITGITGRIGATLAAALVEAGHAVRGLVWPNDRQTARLAELPLELIEGSLTDPAAVAQATEGMEVICHLGAAFQAGGPFTPDQYFGINVRGTFNVLEAARSAGGRLRHLFFASTDALYDKYPPDGVREPIREDEFPLAPSGLYALTKQLGENLCRGYARTHGMPVTVFRFALTVAGDEILTWPQFYLSHWLQIYSQQQTPGAIEVNRTLARLASEQGEMCLLLARDAQGRSYKKHIADARDIVQGFLSALNKPPVFGQVFQLAAPRPFTWEEAIPYLATRLDRPYVDVRLVGQTPTYYEYDLTKSRTLLGFAPQHDIYSMIDDALAKMQKQG
jgi:nucleoside-diphosphate-sugar epimerase